MSADGYECPNCGHLNRIGVLVCENCGRSVLDISINSTRIMERVSPEAVRTAPLLTTYRIEDCALVLQFEAGKPITIQAEKPITLGRDSNNNPRRPDVDLTPFGAFEKGVSRFHALLGYSDGRLMIADLGSANGTFIMDERLLPHRPYLIQNRDQVRLASLRFVVEVVAMRSKSRVAAPAIFDSASF